MDIYAAAIIAVCVVFTFITGFHDGCNIVATIIASRSISPKRALWIASIAEFAGPLVLGTSVASTIAKGIINYDMILSGEKTDSYLLIFSALLGAILWNLFTWWIKIPSSSSHALIGGLTGAGITVYGLGAIHWDTFFLKVVIVLFTSPLIGFVIGYLCLKIVVHYTKDLHLRTNGYLKKIQVLSVFLLGASHGSNDAQKSMGIIALILVLSGYTESFTVPLWVMLICALSISLGLSSGGWRLMKAVGSGIFNIKPVHSFCSQVSSSSTIILASLIGGPVSATQIIGSSIMGVGAAERKNAVRWSNVKNVLVSWLVTIPASAAVTALLYYLIKLAMDNRI